MRACNLPFSAGSHCLEEEPSRKSTFTDKDLAGFIDPSDCNKATCSSSDIWLNRSRRKTSGARARLCLPLKSALTSIDRSRSIIHSLSAIMPISRCHDALPWLIPRNAYCRISVPAVQRSFHQPGKDDRPPARSLNNRQSAPYRDTRNIGLTKV